MLFQTPTIGAQKEARRDEGDSFVAVQESVILNQAKTGAAAKCATSATCNRGWNWQFSGEASEFAEALSALATQLGGSFAAEHGLGRAKIALAERNRGAVERELMARLKGAFDPMGTMNPGVLLRTAE